MNQWKYIESDSDSLEQTEVGKIQLCILCKMLLNFVEYLCIFDIFRTMKMTSKIYHLKLLKRGQEVILVCLVEQGEREGWTS